MKKLIGITVAILLTSSLLFVTVCAGADPIYKPLKGKWSGTLYTVGICSVEPLFVQTINVGKGVSSLAGESDFLFVYCINAATGGGSGWGIITSAFGDRLHLTAEVAIDMTKDPVEWSETEIIVGGTGRFEDVIGDSFSHGIWTSDADLFPGVPPLLQPPQGWVGTSEGSIEFPR